ncbi:uncharacterized protein [Elaeis guineensis]|uniref:Uncharacterized protein LOC114914578 isoform X1 n=1 Tax=Elaeis guineensis var. tenera TaxID=51953 RepID=A0A8N4F342_ELAGV|nr:uncharacterized protein LOC114914578 isoform X1 [Elaeis guineensis]
MALGPHILEDPNPLRTLRNSSFLVPPPPPPPPILWAAMALGTRIVEDPNPPRTQKISRYTTKAGAHELGRVQKASLWPRLGSFSFLSFFCNSSNARAKPSVQTGLNGGEVILLTAVLKERLFGKYNNTVRIGRKALADVSNMNRRRN